MACYSNKQAPPGSASQQFGAYAGDDNHVVRIRSHMACGEGIDPTIHVGTTVLSPVFGYIVTATQSASPLEEFSTLQPTASGGFNDVATIKITMVRINAVSYQWWRGDYRRAPLHFNGETGRVGFSGCITDANAELSLLVDYDQSTASDVRKFRRSRAAYFALSSWVSHNHQKTGGGAFQLFAPHPVNEGITWIDDRAWGLGNSQSDFWNINLFGGAGGPQTFTQNFTAALSPTATLTKAITHGAFAATLSFTGVFAKGLLKLLSFAATLSFAGALRKQTGKPLAGTLSFAAADAVTIFKNFSATFSPTGGLIKKNIRSSFNAALSFTGAFARSLVKLLNFTATLSFAGALSKQTGKGLSASLSFAGALLKKLIDAGFTATLSFGGALAKRTSHGMTATLSFSAAFIRSLLKLLSFSATLSFAGALTRRTNKNITATLSFAGAIARRITHAFTAGLSFVGNLATSFIAGGGHLFTQAFTATLSTSATLSKRTTHGFTASLSFVGALARSRVITKAFTATLSMTGALSRRVGKSFGAALGFVGAVGKQIRKTFSATLSFFGSFTFGGALTFLAGMIAGAKPKISVTGSAAKIAEAASQVGIVETGSSVKIQRSGSGNFRVERTK